MFIERIYKVLYCLCVLIVFCKQDVTLAHNSFVGSVKSNWILRSNSFFDYFISDLGGIISPETAANTGVNKIITSFISTGYYVYPNDNLTRLQFFLEWKEKLVTILQMIPPEEIDLRADIEAIKIYVERRIAFHGMYQENIMPLPQNINDIFLQLRSMTFKSRNSLSAHNIKQRFSSYVNVVKNNEGQSTEQVKLFNNHRGVIPSSMVNMKRFIDKFGSKVVLPPKEWFEAYLTLSKSRLDDIRQLLTSFANSGWHEDFEKFTKQVAEFDEFIAKYIIKRAKPAKDSDSRYYQSYLVQSGINDTLENITELLEKKYNDIYEKLHSVTSKLAKKYKVTNTISDVLEIINRKSLLHQGVKHNKSKFEASTLSLYKNAVQTIRQVVKKNNLISLPINTMKVKLPNMSSSFSRVEVFKGDKFVYFVVPTADNNYLDFTDHGAVMNILSRAETTFSFILERGFSQVRSMYFLDPMNRYGWQRYFLNLLRPYFSLETQFILLRDELLLCIKALSDIKLHHGTVSRSKVREQIKSLGINSQDAEAMINKLMIYPVEAVIPAYGEQKIMNLEEKLINKYANVMGGRENAHKYFRNMYVSYGFLPIDIIEKLMIQELRKVHRIIAPPSI